MYLYSAKVLEVLDGDTIKVDIDLGFGVFLKNQSIRLSKINAPELKGETKDLAEKSKKFLENLILNKNVQIKTEKNKEKYGRWLGTIFVIEENYQLLNINNLMVINGYAKEY